MIDQMELFGRAFCRALLDEDIRKADEVFDLQTWWLSHRKE